MDISIHAPACGERQRNRIENFKNITFLSTLPMRGATAFAVTDYPKSDNISIHAPARGATDNGRAVCKVCDFYPRSRKGSDAGADDLQPGRNHFYPRSRKGSDDQAAAGPAGLGDFYPRSRKGSDSKLEAELRSNKQFLSTLPQGERQYGVDTHEDGYVISIHAPARGATGHRYVYLYGYTISIHAPARGATRSTREYRTAMAISIHAPARGATDAGQLLGADISDFYPRSRKGSDNATGFS